MKLSERETEKWVTELLRSEMPTKSKFVGTVLARYMDFRTLAGARPGNQRLAQETGYSLGTIRSALWILEFRGWVQRDYIGNGRGRASMWRGLRPSQRVQEVPPSATQRVQDVHPSTESNGAGGAPFDSGKGATDVAKGVTSCAPPSEDRQVREPVGDGGGGSSSELLDLLLGPDPPRRPVLAGPASGGPGSLDARPPADTGRLSKNHPPNDEEGSQP